uniref:Uncharacterized protein n=1 Tax=Rhizophora mucronata TaxID=61149 RepID=A0A2P2NP94_RHIMU
MERKCMERHQILCQHQTRPCQKDQQPGPQVLNLRLKTGTPLEKTVATLS